MALNRFTLIVDQYHQKVRSLNKLPKIKNSYTHSCTQTQIKII